MVSLTTTVRKAPAGRLVIRSKSSQSETTYFATLEADSHRPEAQEAIREAIRRGAIRVKPVPGCENRVKIVRIAPEAMSELSTSRF